MYTAALYIIAQNLKQCKCLSIGEWIKKSENMIYPYDQKFLVIEGNKLLIHTTAWINIKNK